MKMTFDIDCTPEEARRLFGLPDVSGVNEMIVEELGNRTRENMDSIADPERFLAGWMSASGKGFEQFQQMMMAGRADGTKSGPKSGK